MILDPVIDSLRAVFGTLRQLLEEIPFFSYPFKVAAISVIAAVLLTNNNEKPIKRLAMVTLFSFALYSTIMWWSI